MIIYKIYSLAAVAVLLVGSGSRAADPHSPNAAELIKRARGIAAKETDESRRMQMLFALFSTQVAIEDDAGVIATRNESPAVLEKEKLTELLVIVEYQAKRGRIEAATRTAALIDRPGARGLANRDISLARDRAGDHDGADRLIREIASPDWRLEAWVKVTRQRREAGRTAPAKRSLAEAIAMVAAGEGKPSIERLCDLAREQGKLGDLAASREALRKIREREDLLTDRVDRAYGYFFIVSAQANSGDVSGAWESAGTLATEEDVFGTPIKDKGIREIAEALADQGRFADSEAALAKIGDRQVRARGLADLATAEIKAKALDRARKHLDEASAQLATTPEDKTNTYMILARHSLVMAWLRLGDKTSALRVARIAEKQRNSESLKEIVSAYAADGEITTALELLKSIDNEIQRADGVFQIARERARRNDPETLKWAEGLPSALERLRAFLGMAEGVFARPPRPRETGGSTPATLRPSP